MWRPSVLPITKKKPKDLTAISPRTKQRLSPAEFAQLERYKTMLKPGVLDPEKAKATQALASMMEKGQLGPGSELLLKRSRTGKALAAITERSDPGAAYLPNMGAWGVLAHALGITAIAKGHAARKRKVVLAAIGAHIRAQPENFKYLVFSVARFLQQNHEYRHTAIYDPNAEKAIHELFGRQAEKSKEYSKKFPRAERQALEDYGKQYLRSIIRNSLFSNFEFLQRQHGNPEKMAALRYALVGGFVDPLTETRDRDRILFVQDIFAKDIPELNRGAGKGMRPRAFQALIRVRSRAMDYLGTREAVNFYYQVCSYYNIKPREVDRYAIDLYWGKTHLARPGKPEMLKERPRIKRGLDAEKIEEYEKGIRTATAREKELKERIMQIYGEDALERYKPKQGKTTEPAEIYTPAIVLPSGGITFRPARKR
ncbi:Uncharacterised protein [uncultured archaeon]|nr:Uncharacterised protein [uncultured archaeon]